MVFGHVGKLNNHFNELINRAAITVAQLHHREHSWKDARVGVLRARAGVMRYSM